MKIEMLASKIHRATVTDANLNYVGSITIDERLMKAANLLEFQKVEILDIDGVKVVVKPDEATETVEKVSE